MRNFDIIIVGGGPAGSSAALFAARSGLKTLLLDKAEFPRDKVCGDAISGKSLNILKRLGFTTGIQTIPQTPATGVIFSSPNGKATRIKFRSSRQGEFLSGYVSRRIDFDNMLFQQAKSEVDTCLEKFRLTDVIRNQEGINGIRGIPAGDSKPHDYHSRIIIGADGYKSMISRKLNLYKYDSAHTLVALRAYYKEVSEMTDYIEIHFVKESLPGYFWIFPLPEGFANVGIGIRHLDIKKRNLDLPTVLQSVIQSPTFSNRFKNAQLTSKIKGWNLPTGSIFRPNYTDGVLLIGDAAGLIDPFTGEGIGNAMTSAEKAVQVAAKAIAENDTSANVLSEYDRLLKQELSGELNLSYKLQQIGIRFPFLLNLVIGKASRSQVVAEWISSMIADEVAKKDLIRPQTYFKLLWA